MALRSKQLALGVGLTRFRVKMIREWTCGILRICGWWVAGPTIWRPCRPASSMSWSAFGSAGEGAHSSTVTAAGNLMPAQYGTVWHSHKKCFWKMSLQTGAGNQLRHSWYGFFHDGKHRWKHNRSLLMKFHRSTLNYAPLTLGKLRWKRWPSIFRISCRCVHQFCCLSLWFVFIA